MLTLPSRSSHSLRSWLACALVAWAADENLTAQTLIWDANAANNDQPNGSGQWLGAGQWYNGTSNVTWDNALNAIARLGVTGSAPVAPNQVTITGGTATVGGLIFGGFSAPPATVSSQRQEFILAGATGGILNFANHAVIDIEDNSSGGSNFITFATSLAISGNGLTLRKSGGTGQQFVSFTMTGAQNVTGTLKLEGVNGGLFVRSGTGATFSNLSSIIVENNSCLSMAGGGTYSVPISIAGTGGNGNYGAIRVDANNTTVTAPITLTADAGIQTNINITGTLFSGGITGAFGFTRFATGTSASTFTLAGQNTYTGATTFGRLGVFAGGVNTLDFAHASSPTTNILYSNVATPGALNLITGVYGGTRLNLNGKDGTTNSQSFGNLTVTSNSATLSGLAIVALNSGVGGSMTLNLGTISRSNQGMVAFFSPVNGSITTTQADGFLGPWATHQEASGYGTWAQVSSGQVKSGFVGDLVYTSGSIAALSGYSTASHLSLGDNSIGTLLAGGTTTVSTLTMNDQGYDRTLDLAGGTLLLGSGGTPSVGGIQQVSNARGLTLGVAGSAGSLTSGGPSAGTAGQLIITNLSTQAPLTIHSNIINNGAGAVSVQFNGASGSTVVLHGTNTYSGGTTIASGTVDMRSASALGSAGTLSVLEGGAIALTGGIQVTRNATLNGNGINNTGVLRNVTGSNSWAGTITMNTATPMRVHADSGTLTFSNGSATTNIFTGSAYMVFSGAGDIVVNSRINISSSSYTLTKEGSGMLTLNGSNTYTGTTTISGGVLRAANVAAINSTPVTISENTSIGSALELTAGGTYTGAITFNGTGVGGMGAIRNRSGDNTLSGTLSVGLDASTPRISADAGTILTLSGIVRSGATSAGTRTFQSGGAGTLHVTGQITNGTTAATYITAMNKVESGTLNLRNTNTYTGLTTVSGGVLNLDFANATPTSQLIPASNAVSLAGGTLQMTGKDAVVHRQGFATTAFTAARSSIQVSSGTGGESTMNLGFITRSAGSAVRITLPATGAVTTTSLNFNNNGIFNGGTLIGTDWAVSSASQSTNVSWSSAGSTIDVAGLSDGMHVSFSGTVPTGLTANTAYYVVSATGTNFKLATTPGGTALTLSASGTGGTMNQQGALSALSSYSSTLTTGTNVSLPAGTATSGSVSINSLRFDAPGQARITLSGTLTLLSGGILVTPNVGANDVTIESTSTAVRTLTPGSGGVNELILHQLNPLGALNLPATLTFSNATNITKTGPGVVNLGAVAASTGVPLRVLEGTFNVQGDNRFTSATAPTITLGTATTSATLSFGNGALAGAETISSISVGSASGSRLLGNGSGLYTLGFNSGSATTSDLRNLVIGGTGTNEMNLAIEAFSGAILRLGPSNAYAGGNNIGRAVFEVSSLADAGVASSLGTGALDPEIVMNFTTSSADTVSTLRYVGSSPSSTNRVINLKTDSTNMPSLTAVIENTGSGTLKFTSAFTVSGSTTVNRVLSLTGTNSGLNEIVGISDGPASVVRLDKSGTGRWILTGSSSYSGGTTVSNGILQLGNGGASGMIGSGSVALSAGASLVTQRSDAFELSQTLTGAGALVINNTGTGNTRLSATDSSYSGGTWIQSGTLSVINATGSATGTGAVTVMAGATLAGSGRLAPSAGNGLTVLGSLSVGETASTAADLEILTSGGASLVIDGSGALILDLISGAGLGDNTGNAASADLLRLGGTMTINPGATLRVLAASLSGFTAGDRWRLIDWTSLGGTASGSFTRLDLPTLSGGLTWDVSFLTTTGTISVVPEVSRSLLTLMGLSLLFLRRRRHA